MARARVRLRVTVRVRASPNPNPNPNPNQVVLFGGWDGVSPLNTVHVLDTAKL